MWKERGDQEIASAWEQIKVGITTSKPSVLTATDLDLLGKNASLMNDICSHKARNVALEASLEEMEEQLRRAHKTVDRLKLTKVAAPIEVVVETKKEEVGAGGVTLGVL